MKELSISASHLDQIEHLLSQSMNGIHLLFDNETIRRVLAKPTEEMDIFQVKNLTKVQELFTKFIEHESFHDKQIYLESLPVEDFETLLRTYFQIVDNSIFAADSNRH